MFGLVKKMFVVMTFFSCNALNVNPLKYVLMNNNNNNNNNNNKPSFYPHCVETIKYSGSCNNINDPYAKLCVSDAAKKINVKVFNLV